MSKTEGDDFEKSRIAKREINKFFKVGLIDPIESLNNFKPKDPNEKNRSLPLTTKS